MDSEEWMRQEIIRRFSTWKALVGPIDNAPLSDVGRATLRKAVDVHTTFFTDGWLAAALQRGRNSLTSPADWPLDNKRKVIAFLERSARIQLLDDTSRAALATSVSKKPGVDTLDHTDIVLETYGLAARAGWRVEVLEEAPGRKSADLRLNRLGIKYHLEVTSLGFGREMQLSDDFSTVFHFRTVTFEDDHGVELIVQLRRPHLTNDEMDLWFEALATEVRNVRSGAERTIERDEGTAVLFLRGERPEGATVFASGPIDGNDGGRLGVRLRDKALQTRGLPAWIRVDEGAGMFVFSPMLHLGPGERHVVLRQLFEKELADFPHVRGVILSHGAELDFTTAEEGMVMLDRHRQPMTGSAYVDRQLPGGRRRHTYVVALENGARLALPPSAELQPASWYEREPSWLDWAHHQLGLPPVEALLAEG